MRNSDIQLWPAIALAGVLVILPASMAKAETASSTVLANTCFSCHGTDGHSAGAMPSINGRPAAYISTMLKAFRADKKKVTVMNRIAKGFSLEEIESLAKYFSENKN